MIQKRSKILFSDTQKKSIIFRIIEFFIVISSLLIFIILSYIFFISAAWDLFYTIFFIAIFLLFTYSLLSPTIRKRERFQIQLIKLISVFSGLGFTLFVLMIAYGDQAVIFILKGISLQNLISIFENLDFWELFSYFYFLVLFVFLFFVKQVILKKNLVVNLSDKQYSIFSNFIDSFKEGAFTFPVIIMIVFPLLLQEFLPGVINIIVLVELFLPFILIGELYRTSENHLIKFINQIKNEHKFQVNIPLILILTFPLGIFVLLETGLISFLNLIYYNFLWENPDSIIAIQFWNIINLFFSVVSFNNAWLTAFYVEFKYYLVTFVTLAIISKIYLLVIHFIRIQSTKQIERFILTYE